MITSTSRRSDTAINASSMADIAFLLLVFFLVTTTIDIEKGIRVRLPPAENVPPPPVHKRNLFAVHINFANELLVRGEPLSVWQLKEKAKEFIMNPLSEDHLAVRPNQAVVSLQNDRSTSYQTYISVYNELKAAYNELWEEQARKRYGSSFSKLPRSRQEVIKDDIPLVISEGEIVERDE